jgi:hypothetical protein
LAEILANKPLLLQVQLRVLLCSLLLLLLVVLLLLPQSS